MAILLMLPRNHWGSRANQGISSTKDADFITAAGGYRGGRGGRGL